MLSHSHSQTNGLPRSTPSSHQPAFHAARFLEKALLKAVVGVCVLVALSPRWALALPSCCQMPKDSITIEYFALKDGHKEIVKDVNDPKYNECFLGYFIPESGETYVLADGTEGTFVMPDGWTFVEKGDKRYHQSPGGAPGVDIFGWVDNCCRVHLFDERDKVYAWKAGPITVNNPDNKEIQIGHLGGSFDLYLHVAAQDGLSGYAEQGDLLGTLDATNKHLHFSVNIGGKYKNPLSFMDKKKKTCVIPEPHSAVLFFTGALLFHVGRKRKR